MQDDGMKFTPGGAGVPADQQQLNVDASTLETFVCTECKHYLFQNLIIVKKISSINPVNTTGKEMFAPMQVLSCTNCGHIPDEFGGKSVPKEEDPKEGTDNTGPGI